MAKRDVRIRISAAQLKKLEIAQQGIKNNARDLRELAEETYSGPAKLQVSYLQLQLRNRAQWWDGFAELQEVINEINKSLKKRQEGDRYG